MTIAEEYDVQDIASMPWSGNGAEPVKKKVSKIIDDHRKMRKMLTTIVEKWEELPGDIYIDIAKFLGITLDESAPDDATPEDSSSELDPEPEPQAA